MPRKKTKITGRDIVRLDSFEYFDDRYYELILAKNLPEQFYKDVPAAYRGITEKGEIEIFLPSVTTIQNIKRNKALEYRRGEIGNDQFYLNMVRGQDTGSSIHTACANLSKGGAVIYQNLKTRNVTNLEIKKYQKESGRKVHVINSQEQMLQIDRFAKLLNLLNPTIMAVEHKTFNLDHCYAGTIDYLIHIKEEKKFFITSKTTPDIVPAGYWVMDLKTGKFFDEDSVNEQMSAYIEAHPDKDNIQGAIGIHTNSYNKTGIEGIKLVINTRSQLQFYFNKFLVKKQLFILENREYPKRLKIPTIVTHTENKEKTITKSKNKKDVKTKAKKS